MKSKRKHKLNQATAKMWRHTHHLCRRHGSWRAPRGRSGSGPASSSPSSALWPRCDRRCPCRTARTPLWILQVVWKRATYMVVWLRHCSLRLATVDRRAAHGTAWPPSLYSFHCDIQTGHDEWLNNMICFIYVNLCAEVITRCVLLISIFVFCVRHLPSICSLLSSSAWRQKIASFWSRIS